MWGWRFDISIPKDVMSGVYIATFVEGDGNGTPAGGRPTQRRVAQGGS